MASKVSVMQEVGGLISNNNMDNRKSDPLWFGPDEISRTALLLVCLTVGIILLLLSSAVAAIIAIVWMYFVI